MDWMTALVLAYIFLGLGAVAAVVRYAARRVRWPQLMTVPNILLFFVFLGAFVLYMPVYRPMFGKGLWETVKAVVVSAQNALRLFVLDGDFVFLQQHTPRPDDALYTAYSTLMAVLLVVAPILTAGALLTIIKHIFTYSRYKNSLLTCREVCVFSELNDRSLVLAEDMKNNDGRRLIVFAGVLDNGGDDRFQNLEQAKRMGAVLFRQGITTLRLAPRRLMHKPLSLFVIGDVQMENANCTLELLARYHDRDNTAVYTFAADTESELLLASADKGAVKVRRINEVQSLISRTLYDTGEQIFRTAAPTADGGKKITALVLGLGQHGTEMALALPWFCQMDGYEVEIHAYDCLPNAAASFEALCPELMDERYNGAPFTEEEATYTLRLHGGIDVTGQDFLGHLDGLPPVTYVFSALGDDERNITTAVRLRTYFERKGYNPLIQAVVYSTKKKEALAHVTNFKCQPYNIELIGDRHTCYSEAVILDSEVEEAAKARHLRWGDEESFWKYEYNYRSSMASAIHHKMKILCGIPGADLPPEQRQEANRWALRRLEHRRWNAYMRSQGYVHAPKRNDLAKTHHCLVPFGQLSPADQEKDDD